MTIEWRCLRHAAQTTVKPALGQAETLAGITIVTGSRRTFVEGHHDVGTYHTLGVNHVLWGEEMTGTVNVGTKFTTFFAQFADAGEGKDLETTRIGEYRPVPGVETVKTAGSLDDVETWTEIEMIGVP
jgi:hypothetical protein